MNGLDLWTRVVVRVTTDRCARPKAQKRISKRLSRGKSLLPTIDSSSESRESAAVHHAQSSLLSFSDDAAKGDNDPAVERTVVTLAVTGSDESASVQEKEARSVGGILSR
ncbi:MAG: hypothetical protein P1Q69_02110 [Candidatus Thorarchaeota archaeon]|nr:hypothetical protein [Candidatus Thorarchaeota archaeon]